MWLAELRRRAWSSSSISWRAHSVASWQGWPPIETVELTSPLLSSPRLETGIYELTFHAADYFRRVGITLSDPPLFGDIVVRIGIADPTGNYHVPLLLAPFAYSTYRGS